MTNARVCLLVALATAACGGNPASTGALVDHDVAVEVAGAPLDHVGDVDPAARLVVGNEHLRLSILGAGDSSSLRVETRDAGGRWIDATGPRYGDWLYYGQTVTRRATRVEVLANTPDEAVVRWTFGRHRVESRNGHPAYAYPFERTIWLRKGERGYFSHTRPLATPAHSIDTEHEVGWGGLYGPGTIDTRDVSIRTEQIQGDFRFNSDAAVDAAEFLWEEDGMVRILVPLPGSEFQAPRFPSGAYGGVYVHAVGTARTYGAYLYVAPPGEAESARSVCGFAWRNAPFSLPSFSGGQLDECGPTP